MSKSEREEVRRWVRRADRQINKKLENKTNEQTDSNWVSVCVIQRMTEIATREREWESESNKVDCVWVVEELLLFNLLILQPGGQGQEEVGYKKKEVKKQTKRQTKTDEKPWKHIYHERRRCQISNAPHVANNGTMVQIGNVALFRKFCIVSLQNNNNNNSDNNNNNNHDDAKNKTKKNKGKSKMKRKKAIKMKATKKKNESKKEQRHSEEQ